VQPKLRQRTVRWRTCASRRLQPGRPFHLRHTRAPPLAARHSQAKQYSSSSIHSIFPLPIGAQRKHHSLCWCYFCSSPALSAGSWRTGEKLKRSPEREAQTRERGQQLSNRALLSTPTSTGKRNSAAQLARNNNHHRRLMMIAGAQFGSGENQIGKKSLMFSALHVSLDSVWLCVNEKRSNLSSSGSLGATLSSQHTDTDKQAQDNNNNRNSSNDFQYCNTLAARLSVCCLASGPREKPFGCQSVLGRALTGSRKVSAQIKVEKWPGNCVRA